MGRKSSIKDKKEAQTKNLLMKSEGRKNVA